MFKQLILALVMMFAALSTNAQMNTAQNIATSNMNFTIGLTTGIPMGGTSGLLGATLHNSIEASTGASAETQAMDSESADMILTICFYALGVCAVLFVVLVWLCFKLY